MVRKKKFLICSFLVIGLLVTVTYHLTQQGDINYQQAHRLFVKGKHEEAIPFYEQSLRVSPERLACRKELAYCYLWTKRPGEAIRLFSAIDRAYPDDPTIQFSLAEAYAWDKQYDKAIVLLLKLIDKTSSMKAKRFLAEIYLWDQKATLAIPLLREMLQEDPENQEIQLLLGKALFYTGENEEASLLFEQLLQQEEKSHEH